MESNSIIKFILLLVILLQACKPDEVQLAQNASLLEAMKGDWSVLEATRNNRVAKSLFNSEFYITDTTFACNFLNSSNSFPYSFNGKKINVLNPEKTNYTIRFRTLDTLILKTEIKNFDFEFISVKKVKDE